MLPLAVGLGTVASGALGGLLSSSGTNENQSTGASVWQHLLSNLANQTIAKGLSTPEELQSLGFSGTPLENLLRPAVGVEAYPGTRIPETPQSLQDYLSQAGGYLQSPMYQQGETALSRALSGQPAWDTDLGKAEDYWNQAFYQPALNQYQRQTLPQIRENFAGFGGYRTSGREEAERRSLNDLITNLQGERAGLLWNEVQSGRQAQESALQRALQAVPTAQAYQLGGLNTLLGAGQTQYQLEQAPLEEQYQNWLYQQPYNNPYLQMAQGTAGQQLNNPYVVQDTPWYSNLGASLANAGQTAGGLYFGNLLSNQLNSQQQLGTNYGQPIYVNAPQTEGYSLFPDYASQLR